MTHDVPVVFVVLVALKKFLKKKKFELSSNLNYTEKFFFFLI
jgi:hypothetical protein